MKIPLQLLFSIMLLSCNKQHNPVESQKGIEGKWKLIEAHNGNMEKEKYTISFESTGAIKASDYPCTGIYTFKGETKLIEDNLIVEFKNCSPSAQLWYSIKGATNARLVDNNTLALNNKNCDEGCPRVFKRIIE